MTRSLRACYQSGCDHPACREANTAYLRAYRARRRVSRPPAPPALRVGDEVRHPRLGSGRVLELDGERALIRFKRARLPRWHGVRSLERLPKPVPRTGGRPFSQRVTAQQREEVLRLRRGGRRYREISALLGISVAHVGRIVNDGLQ